MHKPLVSIIIPVYNAGKYLCRCLDSIVAQSFDDIEIITVNNGSTDDSLEILNEYEEKYPEKMKVFSIPHAKRAGTGRNYGMTKAQGKYICFSDSDDMMDTRAVENLYNIAENGNHDIVFSPYYRVCDNKTNVMRVINPPYDEISNQQMILECEPAPWAKIFRREFLAKIGDMPEEFSFEDLAYFYVYSSYAKNIGYCPMPTYYYFVRSDSEVNTLAAKRIAETVCAELWGLERCNPDNRETVIYSIAVRLRGNLISRWPHVNTFIDQAKRLWPYFCLNEKVVNNKRVYEDIKKYVELSDERIPNNIYISGFMKKPTKEFLDSLENSFYDEVKVVVLDETTCDVTKNEMLKDAYAEGQINFIEQYFIFENIYNNGGIYLAQDMVIDIPFDFVKHLKAFFSYKSEGVIASNIFGGIKNHKVFGKILSTFNNRNMWMSMSERIQNILFYEFHITTIPQSRIYAEISTFLPTVFLVKPMNQNSTELHMSHIDYRSHLYEGATENNEIVSMEHSVLTTIVEYMVEQKIDMRAKQMRERDKENQLPIVRQVASNDNNSLNERIRQLESECEFLRYRVSEIEKSMSWKISQKIIRFSNTFWGKPLRWMINLLRK